MMSGNPELVCAFCERAFSRIDSLRRHIRNVHGANTTLSQNDTTTIEIQEAIPSSSKAEEFSCEVCGKLYNRLDNLRRHKRSTHEANPVVSEKDPTTLIIQEASSSSSEAKEFSCEVCGKHYSRLDNLNRHKKKSYLVDHESSMQVVHTCDVCGQNYSRLDNLRRHKLTHEESRRTYICNECGKEFHRKDKLQQHITTHTTAKYSCPNCPDKFLRKADLQRHIKSEQCTSNNSSSYVSVKRRRISGNPLISRPTVESLNTFKTIQLEPDENSKFDIKIFFDSIAQELFDRIEHEVHEKGAIKFHLILKVTLERISSEGETITTEPYLHSDTYTQLTNDNIESQIQEGYAKILKCFDRYVEAGSGWRLKDICYLELEMAKYNPLRGSSFIPLPRKIKLKNAILNVKNSDEKCIVWCLLASQLNVPVEECPDDVSHYTNFEDTLNLKRISFPMPYQQVRLIERQNKLRVNIFGYEEGEITILYISEREEDDVINLLLIATEDKQHYTLIRNFSRFLGNRTKHHEQEHYCYRCLHAFSRKDLLEDHTQYCKKHAAQIIQMPEMGDNYLKFKNIHMQHPIGYTIYADFECVLEPIDTKKLPSDFSYTQKTARHIPCGFAYVVIGPNGRCVKQATVYRGKDAVERFLKYMLEEEKTLGDILMSIKPMKLTREQEKAFQDAVQCCICKKVLGSDRIREHNHLSGEYRGAAHSGCNLRYRQPKSIPVIFHNLRNYDGHLLMSELGKFKDHVISVIATTLEKFITFRLKKPDSPVQLVFLHSFQFLSSSLEKLVDSLQAHQFPILKEHFPSDTHLNLLRRKGVFPYNYITSMQKFNDTQLPPPSQFFNSLTQKHVHPHDYQHALKVWKTFNIQTLGDYHDLYVLTDVLLLADVFQNFRSLCQRYYDIDACHVMMLPGLSWNACLKMCDITLELLTDIDMLMFLEEGVRGGVSQISHRYAVANNPACPGYKRNELSSYILYLDANNLYGWAMSQFLPYAGFEWVDATTLNEDFLRNLGDESPEGYILEVDLRYPEELHTLHNEYPLAPERVTVSEEMLSPYAKSLLNNQKYVTVPKLIPNLNHKYKYVIHYRNLKLYLQLGLELKKIHRALKFKQAPWLRKYIDFNTEKRKQVVSSFDKDFFKFLNNAVFGKTMENLRKRRSIELCTNEVRAQKLVASPNYKNFMQYEHGLVAVERKKLTILMDRPIYVGFTILELSKVLMYKFHYTHIKKIYPKNSILLFTDTDSLTYHITTPNIYDDLEEHAGLYDFSDYPTDHKLYSTQNKKVLGKFKDELCSEPGYEFVGLKSKMYSLKSSIEEKKRAKGVATHVVQNKLEHKDYVDCLMTRKSSYAINRKFLQEQHKLYSVNQNKKCLSPFDDKRFLLSDGISSLAYGHKDIPKHRLQDD